MARFLRSPAHLIKPMNFPTLLIVTNYRNLFAYLIQPDGLPQIVEHVDFEFDSQTSVPLIQWKNDEGCYRALAQKVAAILERYRPKSWGLACPGILCEKLKEEISIFHRRTLVFERDMNVDDINICNVMNVFGGSSSPMLELA